MSDASYARVSVGYARVSEDTELRQYAERMWATTEYRQWRDRVCRAVADGSIYGEPNLDGR